MIALTPAIRHTRARRGRARLVARARRPSYDAAPPQSRRRCPCRRRPRSGDDADRRRAPRVGRRWQDSLFEAGDARCSRRWCWAAARRSSSRSAMRRCRRCRSSASAFFVTNVWNPVTEQVRRAGADLRHAGRPPLIALLIGVPVSFGIALFLTEMCPAALKRPLGTAVELLAAIPSIIYGMWGLFVFAPFFGDYVQPLLHAIVRRRLAHRAAVPGRARTASACCPRASSWRSWSFRSSRR